jgi:uncharacterized lipoprotein YmbA
MANRLTHRLAIVLIAAVTAGCGSPVARFYTLDSIAKADGSPAARYTISVGPVSLPGSVDRPQFVVQVAANQVDLDEFHRWAAPLDDGVARAVAGNLSVILGSSQVAPTALARFTPDYVVVIDVLQFETTPGKGVVIEALWAVRKSGGKTRTGRTIAREDVQGPGFDALAAAHSRALATMSQEIADAIRAQAASRG